MDLLDLLGPPRHMLMPTMILACGRDLLTCPDPWVMSEADTTCRECIAAATPHGGISAWCRAMTKH